MEPTTTSLIVNAIFAVAGYLINHYKLLPFFKSPDAPVVPVVDPKAPKAPESFLVGLEAEIIKAVLAALKANLGVPGASPLVSPRIPMVPVSIGTPVVGAVDSVGNTHTVSLPFTITASAAK